jgi:ABC-2 type transport system ATP-binding protein
MDDIAIKVEAVSKTFKLPQEKNSSIKGLVVNFYKHNRKFEIQQALKNVTFDVKKGEFFGIVGRNGSGKSTLLKLLAGIYAVDKGSIQINGKLTPFIELGVGFNPELTGRENVFLNGALLGYSRKEMKAMYRDIVEFAELERFMDQKLKNYSSGMHVRLAFSISIRATSEILLIDEVLAVGDAAFQTKCFDYFYELKKKNVTVIFVSHDRGSLERFCERGILIDDGKIIESGGMQKVLKTYSGIVLEELGRQSSEQSTTGPTVGPTPYAEIQHVVSRDKEGHKKKEFVYGDDIIVEYEVKIKQTLVNPIMGVTIWEKNVDKALFATNTLIEGQAESGVFKAGEVVTFRAQLPPSFNDGEFYIEPAIANESATVFYDQQPRAATFYISGSNNPHSLIAASSNLSISKKQSI